MNDLLDPTNIFRIIEICCTYVPFKYFRKFSIQFLNYFFRLQMEIPQVVYLPLETAQMLMFDSMMEGTFQHTVSSTPILLPLDIIGMMLQNPNQPCLTTVM